MPAFVSVEVESDRKARCPQLAAALAACRARLDRLARNVAFVSGLMESGGDFVAADVPSPTRLTIHVLAAVAAEEARLASARTKAALAVAKTRGVRLRNPNLLPGNATQARQRATDLAPVIAEIRAAGVGSFVGIARALIARGVPTLSGRGCWDPSTVCRIVAHPLAT